MRTRKAVSLEEKPSKPDPTLLWYSRAVGVMRTKRKFVDPTSWRFQAAIHDYNAATDPYLDPNDPAPAASVLKKYGKQCQHSSWFFLSWHRMYLYFFEQMVADAVVLAGGPADWTLPFWDYTDTAAARKLPWAFRQPTWSGGETNYLYVPQRAPGINEGTTALDDNDVNTSVALKKPLFSTSSSSSDVQFGGPRVKNHDGGVYPFGGVESSPHNHVHVAVGGPNGFMIDPTQAALDPIFWLHHCNIDRLWEEWIRQPARKNPTETAWRTGVSFPFYDATKKPVKMTSSQVVDTKALGYQYQGMTAPFKVKASAALGVAGSAKTSATRRLSMIGATSASFSLAAAAHHIKIQTPTSAGAVKKSALAPAKDHDRVLLHLENIEGKSRAGSYDVYVNIASKKDPAGYPDRFAGRISLFGASPAARKERGHGDDGFSFVLDITDLHHALSASGYWDTEKVSVTFKPVYDWNGKVSVGRVSVNVS